MPLPTSGPNFDSYSRLGSLLGRTHVHSLVREIVIAAYADLAHELPSVRFVYGETAWRSGGSFRPHKTHQNGTSVDFMVPVLDASARSIPLPRSPFDRFGYDLEFDARGRSGELQIDFSALGAHLRALDRNARARGTRLRRVILAPEYHALVPRRAGDPPIPFATRKPWIRHDEHYHVDFAIRCDP